MTDYFTLAADISRRAVSTAHSGNLIMAKSWRDTKHKSLTGQTLLLTDEDLDVVIESLRIAALSVRSEEINSRWIADSHREYLLKWAERFDDVRERIEGR